jgi:rubredoxin-NAD+ reductase
LKPNIDLAKKLNLDTQRGILINDACQTSDPDIYALGDCAESKVGLQAYLEPIRRQAATIAQHLAGADTAFVYHPPLVKTKTPSLPIMVCQPFSHTDEWQSLVDSENQHEWRLGSEEKPQGFLYSGKSITKATQAYQNLLAAL